MNITINHADGTVEVREMNATEVAVYTATQTASATQATAAAQVAVAKLEAHASAITKLKALGLTDNEISAIIG